MDKAYESKSERHSLSVHVEAGANRVADSELAREKMWSRIYLIPLLQAEEDRDLVRRHLADKEREKELLGAETKVYNSDRYRTSDVEMLQKLG